MARAGASVPALFYLKYFQITVDKHTQCVYNKNIEKRKEETKM